MPVLETIVPGYPFEVYYGKEVIRIEVNKPTSYHQYFATPLARELIFIAEDYDKLPPIQHISERIFPNAFLHHGLFTVTDDRTIQANLRSYP
jgi:hypothetical protein